MRRRLRRGQPLRGAVDEDQLAAQHPRLVLPHREALHQPLRLRRRRCGARGLGGHVGVRRPPPQLGLQRVDPVRQLDAVALVRLCGVARSVHGRRLLLQPPPQHLHLLLQVRRHPAVVPLHLLRVLQRLLRPPLRGPRARLRVRQRLLRRRQVALHPAPRAVAHDRLRLLPRQPHRRVVQLLLQVARKPRRLQRRVQVDAQPRRRLLEHPLRLLQLRRPLLRVPQLLPQRLRRFRLVSGLPQQPLQAPHARLLLGGRRAQLGRAPLRGVGALLRVGGASGGAGEGGLEAVRGRLAEVGALAVLVAALLDVDERGLQVTALLLRARRPLARDAQLLQLRLPRRGRALLALLGAAQPLLRRQQLVLRLAARGLQTLRQPLRVHRASPHLAQLHAQLRRLRGLAPRLEHVRLRLVQPRLQPVLQRAQLALGRHRLLQLPLRVRQLLAHRDQVVRRPPQLRRLALRLLQVVLQRRQLRARLVRRPLRVARGAPRLVDDVLERHRLLLRLLRGPTAVLAKPLQVRRALLRGAQLLLARLRPAPQPRRLAAQRVHLPLQLRRPRLRLPCLLLRAQAPVLAERRRLLARPQPLRRVLARRVGGVGAARGLLDARLRPPQLRLCSLRALPPRELLGRLVLGTAEAPLRLRELQAQRRERLQPRAQLRHLRLRPLQAHPAVRRVRLRVVRLPLGRRELPREVVELRLQRPRLVLRHRKLPPRLVPRLLRRHQPVRRRALLGLRVAQALAQPVELRRQQVRPPLRAAARRVEPRLRVATRRQLRLQHTLPVLRLPQRLRAVALLPRRLRQPRAQVLVAGRCARRLRQLQPRRAQLRLQVRLRLLQRLDGVAGRRELLARRAAGGHATPQLLELRLRPPQPREALRLARLHL
eukprot:Rhum_TRINITY_DN14264_c1_g1::Rhum_TRINITY_DN14264_c1_g1_i1::g.76429::m.76429